MYGHDHTQVAVQSFLEGWVLTVPQTSLLPAHMGRDCQCLPGAVQLDTGMAMHAGDQLLEW